MLGEAYDLSLAFIGDKKALTLNQTLRSKNKIANVLSFPLSKTSGEILINKKQAIRDNFSLDYLFIHGLLHLKGLDHGSRMEREEEKLIKLFKLSKNLKNKKNGTSHRRRT